MAMPQTKRSGLRLAAVLMSTTLASVGVGVPAYAGDGDDYNNRGHQRKLSASLTGAKEVPKAGDPDGRGKAQIRLKKARICFRLAWRKIDAPTAAHIHVGTKKVAGPVVVTLLDVPGGLGAPVSRVGGCVKADRALIAKIRKNPRGYYVNIHNAEFTGGAIRGQLHR